MELNVYGYTMGAQVSKMARTIFGSRQLRRGGSVSVEAALLTPLLITLLFGIIEFGFIFKDLLLIHQSAREGARVAAVGATTSEIAARIADSLPTLTVDNLTTALEYRTYEDGWSAWATLGDYDGENDAPANAQIRISLNYVHPLACGPFFARLFGAPGATSMDLATGMVMCREE